MNQPESPATRVPTSLLLNCGLALLILLPALSAAANGQSQPEKSLASSPIRVTHVLGFEDVRRNLSGELSIDDQNLRFQRNGSPPAQLTITSIQNISLGVQDKQVGGVPLMLGKAGVPFGGGRVVSLFSHKKYDSLGVEYLDSRGGFHGGIFRLAKGQGEMFKNHLIAQGAHVGGPEEPTPVQNMPVQASAAQKWSVQVDRVDAGATTLDSFFADAIYENLMRQLPKSKQFKDVLRCGDRNANNSGVLVLKTVVEKYSPGSETRRAVTTVSGATKLKVHIHLVTRDGHVVLERIVDGNVRFFGDNLGATNKIAKNTATILKNSKLPAPGAPMPQQTSPTQAAAGL